MTSLEYIDRHIMPVPFSGCWIWMSDLNKDGYGQTRIYNGNSKPKRLRAHRLVYEILRGKIPDGLELDHLCRVRCCVNPDHLEAVTHAENVRRGRTGKHFSERTACGRGHPYDSSTRLSNGRRVCSTCFQQTKLRFLAKLKARAAS